RRLPLVGECAVAPADVVRGLAAAAATPVQRLELPSRAIPPRMTQGRAGRVGVEVLQLPAVDKRAVVGADVVRGLTVSTAKPVQRLELPSRAIPPCMPHGGAAGIRIEVLWLPVVDQRAVVPADASVQCLEVPSRAIPPRMA